MTVTTRRASEKRCKFYLGKQKLKKFKTLYILFYIALTAVLSSCNKDEGIHGTYRSVDGGNDSFWFDYTSKVQANLNGEILEGTYRVTDKAIIITFDTPQNLVVLTLVDNNSLLRQHNGLQVFTRR